jgi:hypothetical protein
MALAINIALLRSIPDCRDKVPHFGIVFLAGLRFDSSSHVDGIRASHFDGSSDVLGA